MLAKQDNKFNLMPQNLSEALNLAAMIAKSSLCPPAFKDKEGRVKEGDVFIAMQMGMEVGLAPMQAIQNIAVVNGRPCIWGDAALAIAMSHPLFESITESMQGSLEKGDATAVCTVTRRGQEPQTRTFSIADAKRAYLWEKTMPWKSYPLRMLQMRARGFAIRDVFPDALRGLAVREEILDLAPRITSKQDKKADFMKLISSEEVIEEKFEQTSKEEDDFVTYEYVEKAISSATNLEMLELAADLASGIDDEHKPALRKLFFDKKQQLTGENNEGLY